MSQTKAWIKKVKFIYKMEHYSAIENKNTIKFAGKKIYGTRKYPDQKDTSGMYSLISGY